MHFGHHASPSGGRSGSGSRITASGVRDVPGALPAHRLLARRPAFRAVLPDDVQAAHLPGPFPAGPVAAVQATGAHAGTFAANRDVQPPRQWHCWPASRCLVGPGRHRQRSGLAATERRSSCPASPVRAACALPRRWPGAIPDLARRSTARAQADSRRILAVMTDVGTSGLLSHGHAIRSRPLSASAAAAPARTTAAAQTGGHTHVAAPSAFRAVHAVSLAAGLRALFGGHGQGTERACSSTRAAA